MQQRAKVTIADNDDDDGDDDDDVKQEISDTVEKFVQTRHVQTLKYLQHVIDENRHLRLHIEHLKRRQDYPVQSPAVVDPIDPEDPSITEIPPESPEPLLDLEHFDASTNTEGEDFEKRYHELNDELINLKKQHAINRDEFQRELERVDRHNTQLEKDLKVSQHQLIITQKSLNDKQIENHNLTSTLADEKLLNDAANFRISKLDQANKILTQSLAESEQACGELELRLEELQETYQQTEQSLSTLKLEYKNKQTYIDTIEKEVASLKEKLDVQLNQNQELIMDNKELHDNVIYCQQQIQEKIIQEEKYIREKQANSNFKEFVQVKRTLQTCQQENEQLKIELKKLQVKFLNKNE
ncbi:unnamed protein product [Rotaria magnacalcarata]|uniref:Uncharacterized protein n=1 Tax=Rotaria magnacalcarata TaxID=392030 RepID=A0A814GN78_9BILA|nr:unnamed protein product [Rotaria magnacalcarata]CAF1671828.1 unnamed protein product [Rotaria magnacalcarata]CAF2039412.1 unnamed protein product [Rotaria magnacalcarata]CAF2097967.1 unnamed protein product [Rotaria magnacalcarata]CAF2194896.1 unnamed protein product [Rotaria magnacalcarata]